MNSPTVLEKLSALIRSRADGGWDALTGHYAESVLVNRLIGEAGGQ